MHKCNHVMYVHEKNKPLKCSMCDARFSGKAMENLKKHITSVHGAQKPIMCTICNNENNENNYGTEI